MLPEFSALVRRSRAGHAGELLVHAEVVLEGDRGEVWFSGWIATFLASGLVQALRNSGGRASCGR